MITAKQQEVLDELSIDDIELLIRQRKSSEHESYKQKLVYAGQDVMTLLKHEDPACKDGYAWSVKNGSFGHGEALRVPACTRCALINILDNPDALPFGVTLDIKFKLPK